MKFNQIIAIIISLFIFNACQSDDDLQANDNPNTPDIDIPDINEVDNPTPGTNTSMTELGRFLFWDPILSGDRNVSCGTCHHPDFAYADGIALSIGIDAEGLGPDRRHLSAEQFGFVKRNAPTIINTAFNGMDQNGNFDPATAPMFWDNRVMSLEAQALVHCKLSFVRIIMNEFSF